jgi:hypothetical protein
MQKLVILIAFLCLINSIIAAGIDIPKELHSQVAPNKGPIYNNTPVEGIDAYWYTYAIDMSFLERPGPKPVTLEIYNPETKEWKPADTQIYKLNNKTKWLNYTVNPREVFSKPFLGSSKYRLVSEGQTLTKDLPGPIVVVNFKDEGYELLSDKNMYNYSVLVRSTKQSIPIRLYVTKDGKKWVQYSRPKIYESDSKGKWGKLTWSNVPYYSKIEFVADIE